MSDLDVTVRETIAKYHLTEDSTPKEVLQAALAEFGMSEGGMYAAEMRNILYANRRKKMT